MVDRRPPSAFGVCVHRRLNPVENTVDFLGRPQDSGFDRLAHLLNLPDGLIHGVIDLGNAGVGIGIVPESVALRHAKTMQIALVRLNDGWAERKLKICVRSVKDLPPIARALVDRLMMDV